MGKEEPQIWIFIQMLKKLLSNFAPLYWTDILAPWHLALKEDHRSNFTQIGSLCLFSDYIPPPSSASIPCQFEWSGGRENRIESSYPEKMSHSQSLRTKRKKRREIDLVATLFITCVQWKREMRCIWGKETRLLTLVQAPRLPPSSS